MKTYPNIEKIRSNPSVSASQNSVELKLNIFFRIGFFPETTEDFKTV